LSRSYNKRCLKAPFIVKKMIYYKKIKIIFLDPLRPIDLLNWVDGKNIKKACVLMEIKHIKMAKVTKNLWDVEFETSKGKFQISVAHNSVHGWAISNVHHTSTKMTHCPECGKDINKEWTCEKMNQIKIKNKLMKLIRLRLLAIGFVFDNSIGEINDHDYMDLLVWSYT